ncbi:MAG: FAD-dependent oxidoreductase [Sphaerochaeta sp.]|nr:FAD-dependent oxidoreductase [Sphaerochaeta sp.]
MKTKSVLVPMGSFDDYGGWVLDTQFVPLMGCPYLLAHGLGKPVDDASTHVMFPDTGIYYLKVYTSNWVSPWNKEYSPGRFAISLNTVMLATEFGDHDGLWDWEDGGQVTIEDLSVKIALKDLTGFEGRCGFLYFSTDKNSVPPIEPKKLFTFYQQSLGIQIPLEQDSFDMVVVGGGIAGMCAALSSARQGLKTALLQDRKIFGGNNSSEVRVWLGGLTNLEPFVGIGNIVGEFEQKRIGHYGDENQKDLYEDGKKLAVLEKEDNLSLFPCTIMMEGQVEHDCISSITAWDYENDKVFSIASHLFCDSTGDGTLGAECGADFEVSTNGHMGMSNLWYVERSEQEESFPSCPWAVDLKDVEFPGRSDVKDVYGNSRETSLGCWFWESGCELDPIIYAEYARDMNFRAMYGAWDCLKNIDHDYKDFRLGFSAYIGGKRESRRLLGDVILTKAEVIAQRGYEDGCVPSTWNFDVHYPDRRFYAAFHEGDGFLTKDYRDRYKIPFFIPYRCLYSRNINNLFMAGRNISVTHDALGAARVMRTCGMMGEVVGYAAKICREQHENPREVYISHLPLLLSRLRALENHETAKPGVEIQMHNDQ